MVLQAASKDSNFSHIPILDLSNPDKDALAAELRDVCINVGFFYIKNHGVSQKVIDECFEAAHEYFDIDLDKKMELDVTKFDHFRG